MENHEIMAFSGKFTDPRNSNIELNIVTHVKVNRKKDILKKFDVVEVFFFFFF